MIFGGASKHKLYDSLLRRGPELQSMGWLLCTARGARSGARQHSPQRPCALCPLNPRSSTRGCGNVK